MNVLMKLEVTKEQIYDLNKHYGFDVALIGQY